jgi:hypothetical protein
VDYVSLVLWKMRPRDIQRRSCKKCFLFFFFFDGTGNGRPLYRARYGSIGGNDGGLEEMRLLEEIRATRGLRDC